MVRVTLAGPELEGFEIPAPTQHIKFIMPEPGQDRPMLPDPSLPRGENRPGQPRPLMRTYTVRRFDATGPEMDVDFVLHGEGAGSDWVERAKSGDIVAFAGPGGRPYAPDPNAAWYVLAGDETALPAMATLLERLSATMRVRIYAEVAEPADALPFTSQAQLETTWLPRGSAESLPGSLLEAALAEAPAPEGDGRVWLACEATIMRRIRKHLLDAWHLDPASIVTRGYWKQGEPNYRDGDYGED